jgi:WD40 repeat protein
MEELFSAERVNEQQRAGFVRALSALARSGHVWIIGTMRSDFYPRCADIPELAALKAGAGQVDLLPPTAPQLAQMIGDPARAAGLRFEEKTTGERLDHVLQETALRDPQALPLLEFTLAQLYELCSRDKATDESVVLTFAAYDQLGGMEGALARRADEEYAKLPGHVQAALPAVFRALVTVRQGEDEAIVAQPVLRDVFAASPEQNTLIEAFIRARLFVSDRTGGEQKALVRLAHEALLRCWPRLTQWLTANREFLRIRARVSEEAGRWRSEGQLPELLLAQGKPLAEGEFLLKQQGHKLDAALVEYIESSRRSAARARRWRRVAATAFVLSLVIGTVASSYFAWQSNNARKKADESAEAEKNARKKADDATKSALSARHAAEEEKNQKEKQLDRAELLVYAGSLSLAQTAFQNGNGVLGLQYLNECQWNLRGWEHRHLWTRFNSKQTFFGHTDQVTSVAISGDGKRIVSGSADQTVKVWDPHTGEVIHTLKGHTNMVWSVAISADGERIASGSGDKTVKLWDARKGEEILTLTGHPGPVTNVAISADGTRIVSGAVVTAFGDSEWKVWDADKGQEIHTLRGRTADVASVAISADGKRIASVSGEIFQPGEVTVWEADTGKVLHTLKGQTSFTRVAISADGRRIAAVSGVGVTEGKLSEIKVWDADTGAVVQTLTSRLDEENDFVNVALSADGKRVVSGSLNQTLKVWDADSGQETLSLWGHTAEVTGVAINADGKLIVSGSADQTVKVWDPDTGHRVLPLYTHENNVTSLAISAGGKRIASGSVDGTVKVWNVDQSQEVQILNFDTEIVRSVAISADGKRIATAFGKSDVNGGGVDTPGKSGAIRVWDADTGEVIHTLQGHTSNVCSVAISADGKRIVSGGGEVSLPAKPAEILPAEPGEILPARSGELKVWDAETGQEVHTLPGHTNIVWSVAFSADGKRIVSGSWDQTVKVWDADTGQVIHTLKGHTNTVGSVAISADGTRIVSGGWDQTVKVWGAETGQVIHTLKGHTQIVWGVAISVDGKRIVSSSHDGTVKVWDAEKGLEVLTLIRDPALGGAPVAFSADGKRILSGSENSVMAWDAGKGQQVLTLRGDTNLNFMGPDKFISLGFNPDGKRIVTRSEKGRKRCWHAIKGQEIDPCTDPPPPDGQTEAVSPDGKLRIWLSRGLHAEIYVLRND